MHEPIATRRHQEGTVLVIALIFLMVLTLLGVSSIQTTTLDERMAGNVRDRTIAFQAAEAALLAGERWLQSSASNRETAANKDRDSDISQPAQWDGASPAPDGSLDVSAWSTGPASNPVFHVGPPRKVRSAEVDLSAGSLMRTLYPVTAYSTGARASTVVVLQSVYEAPPP